MKIIRMQIHFCIDFGAKLRLIPSLCFYLCPLVFVWGCMKIEAQTKLELFSCFCQVVLKCQPFFEFFFFFSNVLGCHKIMGRGLHLQSTNLVWRIVLARGVSGYEGYQSKTFNTLNQAASTKEQHNHNTFQSKLTPLPISNCKKVL